MKKRIKLLSFVIFFTFFSTIIANAYNSASPDVPPEPIPHYAQGVTTSTFSIYGTASDGTILTGNVTAWVSDIDLGTGIADVSFLIDNTSPSVPSVLAGNPLTNPVIRAFFFKADGAINASITGVGNSLNLVDGSVSGNVYTAINGDLVVTSDYSIDYEQQAPGYGFFRVEVFDPQANNRGWVASGAQNLFVSDYIVGPMAFSIHLTNVTSIFDADDFAQIADTNFIAKYFSTGPNGAGSGVAAPIPSHYPNIDLPNDSVLLVCIGDSVCVSIFASDPNPEDTITVEKVLGAGSYIPVTSLTPIFDTLCFIPDTSGVYEFIFMVTDQHGATDYDTAYYTITLNSTPTLTAPDNDKFLCNAVDSVNFNVSATDPNNGQNFTLEKISGPGSFPTVNGTSPLSGTQKWSPASAGTYNFIYKVTDDCGEVDYDTATWVITFNNPPVVTAPDSSLYLCNPDTIMFNVTGTDSDPNDTLTLELVSGPGSFPTVSGLSPVNGTLKHYISATGTYTYIFKVTDNCGSVDYDTATWFVIKDPASPVVTAPDSSLTFCGPDTIKFTVIATDSNPYDTLKLYKHSGPGTFSPDTARGNPPLSGDLTYYVTASGTYEFVFKAMDNCDRYDFDTATYVITMDNPPTVSAPDSSISLCGPDTIRFTVTATDPDADDTLTLSGPGIPTPIKGVSPLSADIEIYVSSAGTYDYIYTVTDLCNSSDVDTATYAITMNNPPTVNAPDGSGFICGPDTLMLCLTATDPDYGDTITLSGPGIPVPIIGASPLDTCIKIYVDTSGIYNFIFNVTDRCNISASDTATWVVNVNSPPEVSAPGGSEFFCGQDTLTFTVNAYDPDAGDTLTLSGPGISPPQRGVSPLSAEVKILISTAGTYTFVYTVSDSCGVKDTDTVTWIIGMSNPPTVIAPDSSRFFCEPDTIMFRVTATDPDDGDTITLSGSGIPTPISGISPLYADVKFYADTSGTYNYFYQVTNHCGSADYDTATWTVIINNPPVVNAPDSNKYLCEPDTIRFTVTATDSDAGDTITLSGPGIPAPITGVSPLSAEVKFYISSAGSYDYIYTVSDLCITSDTDTATWVITLNTPPSVSAPDSILKLCQPDTISFTVTATDVESDTVTLEGPGISPPVRGIPPLSAEVRFYIPSSGTYTYIYKVTDSCGIDDYDTSVWLVNLNQPPVVLAKDSTVSLCYPDTISFTVIALDPDVGDTITLEGPGIPSLEQGITNVSADVEFYINTSGTYNYIYKVTNGCDAEDYDTATWIVTVNSPPTLDLPDIIVACIGDTARFTVTGNDPDSNQDIALEKLSGAGNFTNLNGKPPLNGNWLWIPTSADTSTNPNLVVFKVTDHCGLSVTDTVTVIVQNCACDIYVEIGDADCANPDDTISIPILLKSSVSIGAFDLRVEFDPTVLYLLSVTRGDGLPAGWEYFTYRQLPCPMCGCCKYKLLLLGLYDIKDLHKGEPIEAGSDYLEIARLKFKVANDNNLRGFFINVCFEWDEGNCTQNTFSDPTGYILYVSSNPDEFSYDECDTQLHSGNEVLNTVCFERCGGVLVCTTGEKVVGDINLNLIPYDPADLTLFASYFIYGEKVFLDDPYWRSIQIANTDVNRDGYTLTLSDFIYMIRVILHDAPPLPKSSSAGSRLEVMVTSRESEHIITFNSESQVGAALLVFKPESEIGTPELTATQMEIRYGMSEDEFRVLLYSKEGNSIGPGNIEILRIKAEKGIGLSSVNAVDPGGRPLTTTTFTKSVPRKFTLHPNYPNPFNPETNISFSLPEDSWMSLKIYNLSGQLVKTLLDNHLSAGSYTVNWDGTNGSGERVASGIYFYKLTAGNYSQTRKMCLVK